MKFFHAADTTRRKMNRVGHLENEDGGLCRSEDGMCKTMCDYFTQLFQKLNGLRENVNKLVPSTIIGEDNDMLIAPFTAEEFKEATFSMQAYKFPDPDGFNPGFYQHF